MLRDKGLTDRLIAINWRCCFRMLVLINSQGLLFTTGYLASEYGDNFLNSALIKLTLRQLRETRYRNSLHSVSKNEHRRFQSYIISGPLYDKHLSALSNLAKQTQSLNLPTIFIIFDAFIKADENWTENKHYQLLHLELGRRLEQMGYNVLDLYPQYQNKMQEMGWSDLSAWWKSKDPLDGHPGPEGHQFIAREVIKYILARPEIVEAHDAND